MSKASDLKLGVNFKSDAFLSFWVL